ncbi:MAG: DUF4388 domain-containing protein [Polyangia bacterium]
MPPSVLIVEDDPLTQRALENLLAPHVVAGELEIRYVDSADGALREMTTRAAELVVCDLRLPKKDGLQLASELAQLAPVRLFFLGAGHIDEHTRERASALGAQVFSTPLDLPELVTALVTAVTDEVPTLELDGEVEVGSLAELTVPRLLLELWEQRRTGTLQLVRGRVQKEVTLRRGAAVAVGSNLRPETLGHLLVTRGRISDAQHQHAIGLAQRENVRLGRVLVRLGYLHEQALLDELAAQMRHKLVTTLRWPDGEFRFEPGEPEGERLELPFETPRLVFSGLRRTARLDEIVPRMRSHPARFSLTLVAERYRATLAKVFGSDGLGIFDQRPLVAELVAHREAASLLVVADVLLQTGCAQLEPLGAGAQATPTRDPLALVELGRERASQQLPPRASDEGLFADIDTAVRDLVSDDDMPMQEDSGVFSIPLPNTPTEVPRVVDADTDALRNEVLAEYLALHAKDHYQLLGVPRDAATQDLALAHAALAKRFRFERFAAVDLGRDYGRLKEIDARIRLAWDTLGNHERRQTYDRLLGASIPMGKRSDPRLDAEVHAHQGQGKLARGEHAAARQKLQLAVDADGEQPDYHALLGWATYLTALGPGRESASSDRIRAAAILARPFLDTALSIDPDHTDAHEFAGRIDAAEGNDEQAAGHLEIVLDHAPTRAEALTLVEAALGRRGEWRRLEQLYRRLIHRLADDATERPLMVWWRLAELYRTRLGDLSAAQVAYETVARLSPDDPRPRRALAALLHRDPASSVETASILREAWRLQPEDPSPGLALFSTHRDAERWDAALVSAMALACRGESDLSSTQYLRAHRPRFLVRAHAALSSPVFDSLRHVDDDRALGALFADVFSVSAPEISLEALEVGPVMPEDALPELFSRALAYACHELTVPAPHVHTRADFGAEIHVGASRPPVLIVGPQALACTDLVLLVFRLGRALSYLRPGRALAGALPTSQLKDYLGAALTLVQPGLRFDDADGRVAELRKAIAGRASQLAKTIRPTVDALLGARRERIHLGRYVTSLARTADRVGLLLCNDLPTAARVVGDECAPGAEDDLIDFALGEAYLQARAQLGLAIAV